MLGWNDKRPLGILISPDRARSLAQKPNLKTVSDLLMNYPRTYARMGNPSALEPMEPGEMYTCIATITGTRIKENMSHRGPREFLTFTFTDGNVTMTSALFGNVKYHVGNLVPGSVVLLYGKLDVFNDRWQLKNPSYVSMYPAEGARFGAYGPLRTIVDIAGNEIQAELMLRRPWLPMYGRRPGTTTAELLGVTHQILEQLPPIPEPLPVPTADPQAPPWPTSEEGEPLISMDRAIREIHQPPEIGPHDAIFRLKFNEALALQLVMALRRGEATTRKALASPIRNTEGLRQSFLEAMPYTLSPGQQAALQDIAPKLAQSTPANILLQGDVGAGKTLVALLSMLQVIDAGGQCAFIAPTEVLAAQHARNLIELLGTSPATASIGVTLLTGSQNTATRKAALLDMVSGQASIVVGTHALFQEQVEFFNLALVVVDEQHRFGVQQRDQLRDQAPPDATPHMLLMTATPIPRSVAMTMFGDLTAVTLAGLPQGRGKVQTVVVPQHAEKWTARIWARLAEEIAAGFQGYVVVPRIEGEQGVEAWAEHIGQRHLPGVTLGVVHGRLDAEEKDQTMRAFAAGEIDVLVATTVIEVGVDVPNATMMVVMDADRLGISQLHQLRGRVGRGHADALCLFVTQQDVESPSWQRLQQVAATTDGFALAELDLATRSEGDVLGASQSGKATRTTLLKLAEDEHVILQAREYATQLVAWDTHRAQALVADIEFADQEFIERG